MATSSEKNACINKIVNGIRHSEIGAEICDEIITHTITNGQSFEYKGEKYFEVDQPHHESKLLDGINEFLKTFKDKCAHSLDSFVDKRAHSLDFFVDKPRIAHNVIKNCGIEFDNHDGAFYLKASNEVYMFGQNPDDSAEL